jgi:DHA1 family bicyclomycin/chloramphenicol resistance-like MFS transporter
VIVTLMGRSSAEYGIWFALSSVGYMAGNFVASRLSVPFGIEMLIWWGIAIEAFGVVFSTVLAAYALHWGPISVFLPQFFISLGNGVILPGAISGAVSVRPQAAGTAAGIIGCVQMALGAAITQYAGTLLANASSAIPMALLMDAIIGALLLSCLLLVPRR